MSEVLEKIKADIAYWQSAIARARETLTAGESVLPSLLRSLEMLNGGRGMKEVAPIHQDTEESCSRMDENVIVEEPPAIDFSRLVSPTDLSPAPDEEVSASHRSRASIAIRRRTCRDEVLDALHRKAPQTSKELEESLKENATPFGPGAIGYALRDLLKEGRVEKASKSGNLWYYRPVGASDGGGE
jgi:hypothetical protein